MVSNNSNDKNKQANTPVWSEGYEWNYTTTLSNSIIGYGVFEGSMYMAISEIGKKEVNNIDYDVFVMDLEASFVMDDDSMYGIGYMDMDIQGQSYYQTSNLATVLEEMDADMTMRTYGEEMDYMVETSREFKPPLNHYEFPIKSTESWETTSTITERTHYKMSGPYGDSDTNTEVKRETASFICLGIENVTTPASYIVLEYGKETDYGYDNDYGYGNDDWEDEPKYKDDNYDDYRSSDTGTRQSIDIFGEDEAYSILYFSPEVKNVVKQVTYQQTYDYDPDTYEEISYWQEGSITELISYKVETDGGNPDPDKDNDKDNDNLPDDWEDDFEVEDPNDDTDGDGFTNKDEYETGTDPNDAEDNPDDIKDEDSDGMPDAWEVYHELDPTDPADAMENPDGDNNNNLEEYLNRKDPFESDDPPPQNNDEDSESVLGFGKIGGFDLAYIYIIIILIIITILTLFGLMVRKRKREKTVSMKKQAAIKEESRVARQEDTTASEELKEDHDDEKSRKEHRAKKDNVLTYDPRPKAPVTDSRRARRRHYPPPPPPPPPQEKTRYEKPNYYGNDYDYPPPPPPTRSRSSSDYYQDRGNDGYGNNRNEYKPYDPALDRKDDFDRYYRKRY